MVVRVIYAIDKPDVVDNISEELASVVVANSAREFQIGLVVIGSTGPRLELPLKPLTVALVQEIRHLALQAFEKASPGDQLTASRGISEEEDVLSVQTVLQQQSVVFDELLIVKDDHTVYSIPAGTTRLNGLKGSRFPKKPVKVVKVFDGDFTVGDPQAPLLSVGVEMYPATRKAKAPEVSTYINDRRVTHTSGLRTEEGNSIDHNSVQRGYMYLKELVVVDDDLQKLMDAEFDGAERWPKAFEMLAVVEAVPPWMVMDRTDYLVGKTERDNIFLEALNEALLESNNNVLARLCHEPRKKPNGERKLKGKLELVVLQPRLTGQLTCSRVPFKEEFKSYYKFSEIPSEPLPSEEGLDSLMDELVDGMTVQDVPTPVENPTIKRIDEFLIGMIAKGSAEVTPSRNPTERSVKSARLDEIGTELMKRFGIVERTAPEINKGGSDVLGGDDSSFQFI